MTREPCVLCRQSPELREKICKMYQTHPASVICERLAEQDIYVGPKHVYYFLKKNGIHQYRKPMQVPGKSYGDNVRTYIAALLAHTTSTYTLKNLRLSGAAWGYVSKRIHEAGLIEPMSRRPQTRWRILATKDELRAWLKKEEQTK